MIHGAMTAMRLALRFSDRTLARPALHKLGSHTHLTVLRARITPAEAWFEVMIEGTVRRVREAVRMSRPWTFQKEKPHAP